VIPSTLNCPVCGLTFAIEDVYVYMTSDFPEPGDQLELENIDVWHYPCGHEVDEHGQLRNERSETALMDVGTYINGKLNGNKCPTDGCWGECPEISDQYGHNQNKYQIATIYWWRTPPDPSAVKSWIEACGFESYSVSHVLWCDDGTTEEDNRGIVAHWEVSFGTKSHA